MEKDNNYWNLHKDIYLEKFSELSSEIRDLITNNPNSKEAKLLEGRVKREVEEQFPLVDKVRVI
tara:strand:- start:688 stop:879 length:192 start_codon:yes stop_codon:yes gene_type:complete